MCNGGKTYECADGTVVKVLCKTGCSEIDWDEQQVPQNCLRYWRHGRNYLP